MTIDDFNEKWDSLDCEKRNEWVATQIIDWEKVDGGWRRKNPLLPEIFPKLPNYLEDPCTTEILDEMCFSYEFLVHREPRYGPFRAQIGYKLLTLKRKVLYECTESSFGEAACKAALMLSLNIEYLDEY